MSEISEIGPIGAKCQHDNFWPCKWCAYEALPRERMPRRGTFTQETLDAAVAAERERICALIDARLADIRGRGYGAAMEHAYKSLAAAIRNQDKP